MSKVSISISLEVELEALNNNFRGVVCTETSGIGISLNRSKFFLSGESRKNYEGKCFQTNDILLLQHKKIDLKSVCFCVPTDGTSQFILSKIEN